MLEGPRRAFTLAALLMHAHSITWNQPRIWIRALAFTCVVTAEAVVAQPLQFNFGVATPTELTPPRVDVITGPTAARLEQARALIADRNWNEAVTAYRELAAAASTGLVALDANRYVTLPTYCQMQLSQLPPEGLAVYRRLADPLAERLYREGVANRDERSLRRIVDELFASSWGDDALLALGEIALERADFSAARRFWEQISPLLRDPSGAAAWIALRDIDLDANWPEVERRWQNRTAPPTWLAYPDTSLNLADIRARLVLVSIRSVDLDRAALELDALRRFHPDGAGRIGGQQGPYAATLERLLASAKDWPVEVAASDWPTFAGAQTRCSTAPALGPVLQPSWQKAVELPEIVRAPRRTGLFVADPARLGNDRIPQRRQQPIREADRPVSCFPVVVGNFVVFNDGREIRAVDLRNGQPAITAGGVLVRNELPEDRRGQRGNESLVLMQSVAVYGVPRCTLTAIGSMVFGRVGEFATTRLNSDLTQPADRIVGIDLAREGLLTFQAKPPDGSWAFDGTPVGDGRHLWVAMRHSDISPELCVACFDASSGREVWRTSIGSADTPGAGYGNEITHNLLTLAEDRIYFNTNLGLVAALDANTGEICWLYRYERSGGGAAFGPNNPPYFDRDPSPCLVHNGLVVIAPADSPVIIALDANTGALTWTNDQLPDALHLLGVVGESLIASGNRLYSLDLRSGIQRFAWPESESAGIRGMGRGLIAGREVFWPTRHVIYALDAVTGERTRSPISLAGVSDSGANLAAAHGHLIIASHEKLMALGPNLVATPNDKASAETGKQPDRVREVPTTDLD